MMYVFSHEKLNEYCIFIIKLKLNDKCVPQVRSNGLTSGVTILPLSGDAHNHVWDSYRLEDFLV